MSGWEPVVHHTLCSILPTVVCIFCLSHLHSYLVIFCAHRKYIISFTMLSCYTMLSTSFAGGSGLLKKSPLTFPGFWWPFSWKLHGIFLIFSPGKPLIRNGKNLRKIQGMNKVLVFYVRPPLVKMLFIIISSGYVSILPVVIIDYIFIFYILCWTEALNR